MAKCSVATTTSGKNVGIDSSVRNEREIQEDFADFTNRDKFDGSSSWNFWP